MATLTETLQNEVELYRAEQVQLTRSINPRQDSQRYTVATLESTLTLHHSITSLIQSTLTKLADPDEQLEPETQLQYFGRMLSPQIATLFTSVSKEARELIQTLAKLEIDFLKLSLEQERQKQLTDPTVNQGLLLQLNQALKNSTGAEVNLPEPSSYCNAPQATSADVTAVDLTPTQQDRDWQKSYCNNVNPETF